MQQSIYQMKAGTKGFHMHINLSWHNYVVVSCSRWKFKRKPEQTQNVPKQWVENKNVKKKMRYLETAWNTGSKNAWLEPFCGVAAPRLPRKKSSNFDTFAARTCLLRGKTGDAHGAQNRTLAQAQTTMPPSFVVGTLSINREKMTEILKNEKKIAKNTAKKHENS